MTLDDTAIENPELALATDESLLLSMDNIALEAEAAELANEGEASDTVATVKTASEDNEEIPDKLVELLMPFADNSAGQDPRYSDEFILIKAEIDKLAFNDYNAVSTLAREILISEGKDLRVAGYYLLANTYLHGLKGLIEGLQLYRLLLEVFEDSIFPERDDARLLAMQWLNNNKLLAYVKQHQKNATRDNIERVEQELNMLNGITMARFNDETARLSILNTWLKDTKKQFAVLEKEISVPKKLAPQSESVNTETEVQARPENVATPVPNLIGELTRSDDLSETELYSLMRKLVNQMLDEKDYQRAVAFARATRWGGMILPPNNNGKTALTPPRQNAVNEITRSLQQGEHQAALKQCESLFFEMGGHMLLDLQCYASKAAKAMSRMDLANLITYETAALLQRFPDLQALRFDDDTPFANAETLAWLNSISGKKQTVAIVSNDADDQLLLTAINNSCEVANEEGLSAALAHLANFRPHGEKQRFQLRLAMAQLCLDHGRAELALPILEDLHELAERTSLAMWEKSLALAVAKHLQSALRSVMNDAADEDKARYAQQIRCLSAQMCRWDLVQAVQLI